MRDQLLFAVAPYGAALLCVTVLAIRSTVRPRPSRRLATRRSSRGSAWRAAWLTSVGVIAFAHLMAVVSPDSVMLWDRRLTRLVLIEGAGVAFGFVALAGAIAAAVRHLRGVGRESAPPPAEVVAATLVVVGMLSGVGIALFYRWASNWSAVTLVPYLHSIARLDPSTNLVTHLPPLVKLHVIAAFLLLAIVPFTEMACAVLEPVGSLMHWIGAALAPAFRPGWRSIERWTGAQLRTALVIVTRHHDEEN